MTITFDNFPIYIGLVCAALGFLAYFWAGLTASRERVRAAARVLFYVCVGCTAYLTLYLLQGLVSAQRYDIAYVFNNSGASDEILYRISALWAGQQGSLLFWALTMTVLGIPLVRRLDREAPLLSAFWLSVILFFFLLLAVDDPFARLEGFQRGMTGAGLNPLLKNPWMAVHPPVVFIGYALLSIPAAFAVQGLADGNWRRWAAHSLPWTAAGWVALTAGLALGMVWSYEVLGWGGYWGWDPVENASLVPWLTGGALLHGLILQRTRSSSGRGNVLLAVGTFLLIVYATFLTRSGVLAEVSVHSFAKTPAHRMLMAMLIFYGLLGAVLTAARWRALANGSGTQTDDGQHRAVAVSRGSVLLAGVVVLVLFAVVVLVGTSYPIFSNVAVQPRFYNRMSVPLALVVCALVAAAPWLRWRVGGPEGSALSGAALRVWWALIACLAVGLAGGVFSLLSPQSASSVLGWLISSERAAAVEVQSLLVLMGASLVALASSTLALIRTKPLRAGALAAHAGVALLTVGVILSSAGESRTLALERDGRPVSALGWSFAYKGIERTGHDRESILVDARRRKQKFTAAMTVVFGERSMVRRPYIRSFPLGDLYIAPSEIETRTITPTASVTEDGLVALPVDVPGRKRGSITLLGLSVESAAARLRYTAADESSQEITVSAGHPVAVDGYTLVFRDFVTHDAQDGSHFTVGVTLGVTGNGLTETAIIEVSKKPMIWLVWIGCVLIFSGGILSVVRRAGEVRRSEDGLLSDND